MEYNLYCKTVILITLVSCINAIFKEECGGGNSLGVTLPKGEINLNYGNNLEVFCILTNDDTYNSSSLIFYRNEEVLPDEYIHIINETTIRLYLMKPPPSNDTYSCKLKPDVDSEELLLCNNVVKIGYMPENVKNFSCFSDKWLTLECSWVNPDNFVETNYSLSFIDKLGGTKISCPNNTVTKNSCKWGFDTKPIYRSYMKMYSFILKGENALGVKEFHYDINHYANVIPAPPINLTVVPNMTSDSLTITWCHTDMRFFPPGLIHMVKYKSQWDPPDYWHTVDISGNPKENSKQKTYVVTIKGLKYAHTLYDIRVFVRSGVGVEPYKWSKPAVTTARNAATIPERPPRTDIGSYEILMQGESHSDVLVYWQQIPQYLENGGNFSYKVYLLEDGVEKHSFPAKITKSYAKFKELPYGNYTFKIVSSNNEGDSLNSSVSFIPSPQYRPQVPDSFIKVDYDHGLYQLSWKPAKKDEYSEDIESYTLFWCEDKKYIPFLCEGFLNWTRVPSNITAKNLTLNYNEDVTYQFAISANTKTMSSGMVWASCSLYPDEVSTTGKMKNMWINKIGSHFMELNWKLDCSHRIGVQHFIIRYCPIGPPQNNTCKEPVQKQTAVRFPNQDSTDIMSYNLTSLKPYTTYMITIAVKKFNEGEGQPSNALFNTTLEAAPDKPPQNVTIQEITNSSIILAWQRPEPLNGVFQEYKVFVTNRPTISVRENTVNITGLDSYTEYKITVSVCTKACSNSSVIPAITKIGYPGPMSVPNVVLDTSKLLVKWNHPQKKGGKINYYEVKYKLSEDENVLRHYYYNSTENQFEIDPSECVIRQSKRSYEVSVRAVNIDENDKVYPGPWSPPSIGNCSLLSLEFNTIVIVSVIGIVCLIFIIVSTCFCTRCLYKKYKNMRAIEISVSAKLTEKSTAKEKEANHVSMHGWPVQIQENNYNVPSPDQQLLLEKIGKDVESNVDETEESVGEVDRESSGCGSGHGSVSSSINGGAQISSDSGTEADQRASSPDVFSDSPSRVCLLRQRNVSNNNNNASGTGGEGYCRVAAPAGSNYVAIPAVNRGYVLHSPTWTNTNNLPSPKGYVVAASPLTPKTPPGASTYCVLGWKASPTLDIPHESNHEFGYQNQSQVSRDNIDSNGVTDSQLDSVNKTLSI